MILFSFPKPQQSRPTQTWHNKNEIESHVSDTLARHTPPQQKGKTWKSSKKKRISHPLDSPSPNSSRSVVAQWLFGAGQQQLGNEQVFHDAPHTRRCYWSCCMAPSCSSMLKTQLDSQLVEKRESDHITDTIDIVKVGLFFLLIRQKVLQALGESLFSTRLFRYHWPRPCHPASHATHRVSYVVDFYPVSPHSVSCFQLSPNFRFF